MGMGVHRRPEQYSRRDWNRRTYLFKMLFVSPLIGVLLIGAASGLRNCDNCTEITNCEEAVKRILEGKSEALSDILRKAHCGYMKVCCSDFLITPRMAPDDVKENGNEVNDQIDDKDEIENHPNVHLLPDECGIIEGGRIIGGKRAKMNEYPWLALISHRVNGKKEFYCGGTVINERYVLTAAHCIKGNDIVGVRIGEYDISTRTDCTGFGTFQTCQNYLQDVGVSKATIHPGYVRLPVVINDIGLLRLKKPLNLTVANAGTSCLPVLRSLRDLDIAGKRGVVAGWGITENRTRSNVLLKVEVPLLDKETCKNQYNGNRRKSLSHERFGSAFCAGEAGHDSCGGDSGGPLMLEAKYKNDNYKLIQFGIVSYGPSQCGSKTPGVYTDLRKFIKWILDTMQP